MAGLRAAEELRRQGFDGSIKMVTAEAVAPYDRPQLSKSLLVGTTSVEKAIYRDAEYYNNLSIDLLLEHRVGSLDLRERCLKTSRGSVDFDDLVICTGAAPRRLGGIADMAGVHELRTLDDGVAIRDAFGKAPRVVVVGAGFIGSEVAASARKLGLDVTIVEASPAPLARALGNDMGLACAGLHADHGTRLLRGVSIESVEGHGRVERVRLTDGTTIDCDLLVVGIGVAPTVDWLAGSGLPIDNGTVCDATLSTPAKGVYAAGDVASWPNELFGLRMRGEQWTNAVEQGRHVARNILADAEEQRPFHGSNYFWSDQYGVRIQFAGITAADEIRIVEGSVAERRFLAWYRRGDRLVGALAMNEAKSLMLSKTLIEHRANWNEALTAFEKATAS
ncbi:NADPH-dependent 2,4-dienoyl-CoA reductase/sulfur reductase-like enzyme [Aminobacter niigataensis]|uniref:NADPH-dependent 2,4-dienoyl-CoA reductase/sulfur reductase-like enzyme n=1 Tax=Aminobacter niigataensis TaxID=83265 RepID=A0ABR6L616_9HYPH|nr:NADPH-dependent 2,4-dienoyl-CoA reductase/sulfur reductase-like enzyme [Aminobacter niigataensis]